jgi:hypothetical protein
MERFISSTVVAWAATQATVRGKSAAKLWVSAIANTIAVSGERMVPPIIAAMPSWVQSPVSPDGMKPPNIAPRAPTMMRSGARTPPEVADPKAIDQIAALTTSNSAAAFRAIRPCHNRAILS